MNDAELKTHNNEDHQMDVSLIVWRLSTRWRLIAGAGVVGLAVGAGVAFSLPEVYTANTKILPPAQNQQGAGAALLAQLGGLANLAGAGSALKSPADLYIGLLKTRTVADRLIEQFDLPAVYDLKLKSAVRKRLAANTVIVAGKDGIISIDVDDRDPARAAKMANAYVSELVKLTKTMALTESAQRRLFFDQQLQIATERLIKAQEDARLGLSRDGLTAVDLQGRALMETQAKLRAQITAQEVRLAAVSSRLTPENAEYKAIENDLSALRKELTRLEGGQGSKISATREADGTAKSLREVKYYEALSELLTKQLEAARLDEARQAAVVQVVDAAEPPDSRSKQHRAAIIAIAFFLFSIAACVAAAYGVPRLKIAQAAKLAQTRQ